MREVEQWRPVVGFEQYYEVSNAGRVRSRDREARHSRGGTRLWRGRILRPHFDGRYEIVQLSVSGKIKRKYVHHLVLEAFIGLRPKGAEACHADDNGANNSLPNLRWDTHAANVIEKMHNGRCPRGAAHALAKLTDEAVREMRVAARAGEPHSSIAKRHGVAQTVASKAIRGRTWAHVA